MNIIRALSRSDDCYFCKSTDGFRRINIPNNTRASSTPPFPAAILIPRIIFLLIPNLYKETFVVQCSRSRNDYLGWETYNMALYIIIL
jgi:hypothetical protein